jgi:hypothetical protein
MVDLRIPDLSEEDRTINTITVGFAILLPELHSMKKQQD